MILLKGRVFKFLHYIPGIIILVLSMFALYSAAHLMETRRLVRENYQHYTKAFLALDNTIHTLDLMFLDYLSGNTDSSFSDIRKTLNHLNNIVEHVQTQRYLQADNNHQNRLNYELTLYDIRMKMFRLADSFQSYENLGVPIEAQKQTLYAEHEQTGDLHTHINKLESLIIQSFVYTTLEGHIQKKEVFLYWLIFIMGFCGFVLIVTNSNKLKELKLLHAEKKKTLELLKERLAALEAAKDGIFIVNAKGKMTYFNSAFYSLINGENVTHEFEYRCETLFGKSWQEIFSPSDIPVIETNLIPELIARGVWKGSLPISTYKGTHIETDMSLTRLPDGGAIGTMQDVSYKNQVQKEKKQLEDQFYQAQKMEAIGRLAGGIAHDFNNILAAMNGYAEFLVEDLEEGSQQSGFAENILKAGLQARSLIDQMLAFSRRSEDSKTLIDLHHTLKEVISMISVTLPKTIELHTDITQEDMLIHANPTQISQMIMNLCVNAQDAMEDDHGSLTITLKNTELSNLDLPDIFKENLPTPEDTPYLRIDDIGSGEARMIVGHLSKKHRYAKISLTDTGVGISRVIMEHIFEPFFTTKPVDKGTGLGLATVLGLLAGHQGFMVLESTIGHGSRFDIYLPFPEHIKRDDAEPSFSKYYINKDKDVHEEEKKKKNKTASLHILLVEDQEDVCKMIVTMIKRLGHTFSVAKSGLEGLDIIRENPGAYDLVITDYNMPKMTGLEMAYQASFDFPDLRFILLSGYSEQKMHELIKGHHSFKAILRKPVSKNVLERIIKEVTR